MTASDGLGPMHVVVKAFKPDLNHTFLSWVIRGTSERMFRISKTDKEYRYKASPYKGM